MSLRCEILSTGDEVLTGQIADTNTAFLSDQLGSLGFVVARHTTVGDDRAMLAAAFRELGARADVVLCTGGLGPTLDDLTTEVAAEVLGVPLKLDDAALAYMEGLWKVRGRPMPENNRKQALIPEPGELLPNPIGTAPGFTVKIDRAWFFFKPGVPREMKRMFAEQVRPRIEALRAEPAVYEVRVLRCFGLAEVRLERGPRGPVSGGGFAPNPRARFPGVKLGFRAHFPEIQIKLTVKGPDAASARGLLDAAEAEVRSRIGAHVFSTGASMEEVVGEGLRRDKATLAAAESCTGGLVSQMMTEVAGSSDYFDRGFVTYTNQAKMDMLGVSEEILREHGAVSEPCAQAMAEGARARARTTYAVSITGLAGPGGGTPDKPVGLVFVGLATPDHTVVRRLRWPGQRQQIRAISAMVALDLLRQDALRSPLSSRGPRASLTRPGVGVSAPHRGLVPLHVDDAPRLAELPARLDAEAEPLRGVVFGFRHAAGGRRDDHGVVGDLRAEREAGDRPEVEAEADVHLQAQLELADGLAQVVPEEAGADVAEDVRLDDAREAGADAAVQGAGVVVAEARRVRPELHVVAAELGLQVEPGAEVEAVADGRAAAGEKSTRLAEVPATVGDWIAVPRLGSRSRVGPAAASLV